MYVALRIAEGGEPSDQFRFFVGFQEAEAARALRGLERVVKIKVPFQPGFATLRPENQVKIVSL